MCYGEACFKGIIAIQNNKCDLILYAGYLCSFKLLDLNIMRILLDVLHGGQQTGAVLQLDDTVILQEKKCSCFVCCIVWYCNHIAVTQRCKIGFGARIDTEGLIMNACDRYKRSALLFVKIVEIRNMLEVVCVNIAAINYKVRLNIIFKFGYFKCPALLGKNFCCLSQNLCMGSGRCCYCDGAFAFSNNGLRSICNNAAFYNESIFIVLAIGVQEGCFIVGMEEVLTAECNDLSIQPVQKVFVALGNCCCNGICTAQRRNSHGVAGIFNGECDDFGIIIGPCNAVSVFKCSFCLCICVIFLQLDIRIILFQISFSRCTGNYDHFIFRTDLAQVGDYSAVRRDNTKGYVHVGKRKVNFLCAFLSYREVCEDDIDLAGLEILNTVCSFGGNIINLNAEIFTDAVSKINIVALIFTVLIHIAERALIGEYANVDSAAFLDFIYGSVHD